MPMSEDDARAGVASIDWHEYRRLKRTVLVLLICWFPFGALCGVAIPVIFKTYTPSYALLLAYTLYWGYSFLSYLAYACPNCGASYKGCQLYRNSCQKCSFPINSTIQQGDSFQSRE